MLSLTLRVVFNLFNCMKQHLKVQLEVFFTSVHLCISNSRSARAEHRELALESLLVRVPRSPRARCLRVGRFTGVPCVERPPGCHPLARVGVGGASVPRAASSRRP